MKTNDKTLADAQPGGRVRLGGEIERGRLKARRGWGRNTSVPASIRSLLGKPHLFGFAHQPSEMVDDLWCFLNKPPKSGSYSVIELIWIGESLQKSKIHAALTEYFCKNLQVFVSKDVQTRQLRLRLLHLKRRNHLHKSRPLLLIETPRCYIVRPKDSKKRLNVVRSPSKLRSKKLHDDVRFTQSVSRLDRIGSFRKSECNLTCAIGCRSKTIGKRTQNHRRNNTPDSPYCGHCIPQNYTVINAQPVAKKNSVRPAHSLKLLLSGRHSCMSGPWGGAAHG